MPTCGCTGSADSAGSRDGLRRCVLHSRGGRRIVILAEIEPCSRTQRCLMSEDQAAQLTLANATAAHRRSRRKRSVPTRP
eukprot:CAMPEP_0181244502 /NCGR_PEP_ID=MMETSP1096-20121128/42900_1 /TAXON_ID=156174 ORGANISM="Chrysochromulina ericina, Strain CCMP281" /NCGR_SAMPLE_ID=MMETSP1096 /ASSEMBLY_ACC=CAM_ASM_000453 /LENGTH=79 /DNA_ID=CAMNT_0023341067 /DNA_START=437 /DNA_END=673 /DNA_ORIENTATION=+